MKLIVIDFISLDGVVQAPGGPEEDTEGGFKHGGWSHPFMDPEVMGAAIGKVMEESDALLFGRRTWEGMAAAWPGRAGDPFADQMNAIQKYVASRTLSAEDAAERWSNSTLLEADAIDAIRELKAADGNVMQIWGSPTLTRQLIGAGLVDEYRLMIEPIMLGGGKTIFPTDGEARTLELVDVQQAKTGTLVCTYRPA
jgi:dihydrofolate reductase